MALLAAARFTCIIQRTRGFNAGLEGTLFTDISRVPFMFVMLCIETVGILIKTFGLATFRRLAMIHGQIAWRAWPGHDCVAIGPMWA